MGVEYVSGVPRPPLDGLTDDLYYLEGASPHPGAPFHFVDGVEAAVAKAQELAGDRVVEVAAGEVGGQVFARAHRAPHRLLDA